jgi:ankyrin repeat protein
MILDRRNVAGNTPLHWAALNGHLDAVKELVGAGAGLDGRNEVGRKAVDEAEGAGWVEVEEWLRVRGGSGRDGEEQEGEEQVLSAGVEEGADGEKVEYGDSERVGAEDGDGEQAMGNLGVGKS